MFNFISKKNIFIVSVPKSGTDYTWNKLNELTNLKIPPFSKMKNFSKHCGGYDFNHGVHVYSDIYSTVLRPETLRKYINGYIMMTHMGASFNNLEVLKMLGIEKISFLVRNPKDALISWYYHCEKHQNYNYFSKLYYHPKSYYQFTKEKKIDHLIRHYFPIIISQINSWFNRKLEFSESVNIVNFDYLKKNPQMYFKEILKFHDITKYNMDINFTPVKDKFHFREGDNRAWIKELNSNQIDLCNMLIGDSFKNFYEHYLINSLPKDFFSENFNLDYVDILKNNLIKYPNTPCLHKVFIKYLKKIKSKKYSFFSKKLKSNNYDDYGNFYNDYEYVNLLKQHDFL